MSEENEKQYELDEEEEEETESDKRYNKDPRAKSVLGFIDGLNILAPHMELGVDSKYFLGSEHDNIYIYTEEGAPAEESAEGLRLSELGFHYDEDVEGWAYYT